MKSFHIFGDPTKSMSSPGQPSLLMNEVSQNHSLRYQNTQINLRCCPHKKRKKHIKLSLVCSLSILISRFVKSGFFSNWNGFLFHTLGRFINPRFLFVHVTQNKIIWHLDTLKARELNNKSCFVFGYLLFNDVVWLKVVDSSTDSWISTLRYM